MKLLLENQTTTLTGVTTPQVVLFSDTATKTIQVSITGDTTYSATVQIFGRLGSQFNWEKIGDDIAVSQATTSASVDARFYNEMKAEVTAISGTDASVTVGVSGR